MAALCSKGLDDAHVPISEADLHEGGSGLYAGRRLDSEGYIQVGGPSQHVQPTLKHFWRGVLQKLQDDGRPVMVGLIGWQG